MASLDDLVAALRDERAPTDGRAEATRRRVLASVERGGVRHRRKVAALFAALTIGTGTLSWAATTGRLTAVLARVGLVAAPPAQPADDGPHRVARAPSPSEARTPSPSPSPSLPPLILSAGSSASEAGSRRTLLPLILSAGSSASEAGSRRTLPPLILSAGSSASEAGSRRTPSPVVPRAPRPRAITASHRAVTAPPRDELATRALAQFRRADALQRAGSDPSAALAAWDAYLALAPDGALAPEARYNRALSLVRLQRWDEAQAALAPFADGAIAGGYRQPEAAALRDQLARRRAREARP